MYNVFVSYGNQTDCIARDIQDRQSLLGTIQSWRDHFTDQQMIQAGIKHIGIAVGNTYLIVWSKHSQLGIKDRWMPLENCTLF